LLQCQTPSEMEASAAAAENCVRQAQAALSGGGGEADTDTAREWRSAAWGSAVGWVWCVVRVLSRDRAVATHDASSLRHLHPIWLACLRARLAGELASADWPNTTVQYGPALHAVMVSAANSSR
jgi:hypothetical protein